MQDVATIPIFEPMLVGQPNNSAFNQVGYPLAPLAAFRRGDFLQLVTTLGAGTAITNPSGGTGALAGSSGPTFGAPVSVSSTTPQTNATGTVTISGVAQASAPAMTYYLVLTYTATNAESASGSEFVVNTAPGYVPAVTVNTANAPAGATNYAVYAAQLPQYEALQQATRTTTATGTAYNLAFPLVNSVGVNRAVTNPSGNIVGMAVQSSLADYYSGPGGSFNINEGSLFGASQATQPLTPSDVLLYYAVKLQNLTPIEISLAQQYSPLLVGQTCGLSIAPNGFFQADTSVSNKILTIISGTDGVPSIVGNGTETSGKRIQAYFNGGLI